MRTKHVKYRQSVCSLFWAVSTLMWGSCVDPITLNTDPQVGELVFFGNFTQSLENHYFNITRTAELGQPPQPVSGASVQIFDNLDNSATYQQVDPGRYELDPNQFAGVPGRSYYVEIILPNGEAFCSSPQTMPTPVKGEDLSFEIGQTETLSSNNILVEQTVINILIDTPLPTNTPQQAGLRWSVDEVYSFSDLSCHSFYDSQAATCYFQVPVDEGRALIFEAEPGVQESLKKYQVHSRLLAPNDEFIEKHYFSVHQFTLTEQALDFWKKVQQITNQSGTLFDAQPAAITGNIYATETNRSALGFFEVSGKDVMRIFTNPFLIGSNRIIDTCPIRRTEVIQDKCCFCWLADQPENRIERPDYW